MNDILNKANVVSMIFGSHLYGLNTTSSDMDYKGIYLPDIEEVILGSYAKTFNYSSGGEHTKNTNQDVDMEVIALPYFIKQACQGETFALDMLHCTAPISASPIWSFLVEHRTKFYSKDMKAYIGYVRKQASKYGLKGTRLADIRSAIDTLKECQALCDTLGVLPSLSNIKDRLFYGEYSKWTHYTGKGAGAVEQEFYEVNSKKYQSTNTIEYVITQLECMYNSFGERAKQAETNEGVDWKAISHAFRAGYQALHIYKDGDFQYPLEETPFIMAVKKGELDYKTEVAPVLEELVEQVEYWSERSSLPSKVDTKFWDRYILDLYLGNGK